MRLGGKRSSGSVQTSTAAGRHNETEGSSTERTRAEKLRDYRQRMRAENPEQYRLYKMRDALRKRRKRAEVKGLALWGLTE